MVPQVDPFPLAVTENFEKTFARLQISLWQQVQKFMIGLMTVQYVRAMSSIGRDCSD